MRGLAMGLVPTGLDQFYAVARSILVKSEAYFDQYDQAFAAMFKGIETPVEIDDEVWDWLSNPLDDARPQRRRAPAAGRRARGPRPGGAPEDVRGAPQGADEAHHGGNQLGGHRRHQPLRPLRVPPRRHPRRRREPQPERRQGGRRAPLPRLPHRPGGRRAAVRARPADAFVSSRRATKASPTSSTSTRPSRRRRATPAASASSGARAARTPSRCCCSWTSAAPCTPTSASAASSSAPSTAAATSRTCASTTSTTASTTGCTRATRMTSSEAISTRRVLQELPSDYKLIIVGDAAMAPSELMARDGIIWWGFGNDEPGIEWLQAPAPPLRPLRVAQHHPRDRLGPRLRQRHHPQGARGLPHVRAHRRRAHRRDAQAHGAVLVDGDRHAAQVVATEPNVPFSGRPDADTKSGEAMQTHG